MHKAHWSSILNVNFKEEPLIHVLRAPDQKYRESHDRNEISYSILIYQKYLFGKLFSKIIFKSSSAFYFFQNLNKFEIRLEARLRPPEIRENGAFFFFFV